MGTPVSAATWPAQPRLLIKLNQDPAAAESGEQAEHRHRTQARRLTLCATSQGLRPKRQPALDGPGQHGAGLGLGVLRFNIFIKFPSPAPYLRGCCSGVSRVCRHRGIPSCPAASRQWPVPGHHQPSRTQPAQSRRGPLLGPFTS